MSGRNPKRKQIGNVCPARVKYTSWLESDSWSPSGVRTVKGMKTLPHEPVTDLDVADQHYWDARCIGICKHCGSLFANDMFRPTGTKSTATYTEDGETTGL